VIAPTVAIFVAISGFPAKMFAGNQGTELPDLRTLDHSSGDSAVPGTASAQLGWGDSEGGRDPIVYLAEDTPYGAPSINSLVDLSFGPSDERLYMQAAPAAKSDLKIAEPGEDRPRPAYDRVAELDPSHAGSLVLIPIDNNGNRQADCNVLEGPQVITNLRVRLSIWNSEDGTAHVVRSWISGRNTSHAWITDAVVVETAPGMTLTATSASVYREAPALDRVPLDATKLLTAGGARVADGKLGGCWENRMALLVALSASTSE
jgi:hypothetical protein